MALAEPRLPHRGRVEDPCPHRSLARGGPLHGACGRGRGDASWSPAAPDTWGRRWSARCASAATTSSASTSCPRRTPTCVASVTDRAAVRRRWRARTPSCTPRRCTSRTSARTPGRSSSTPTSRARWSCWRRRSRPASARSCSPARPAPSAGPSRRRTARPRRGSPRTSSPRAAQHLRRHEGRGRGPVRAGRPRPRPAVRRPADLAVLPGAGRQRAGAQRRTPTPTRRSTSCCTGGSTSPTSSTRTWPPSSGPRELGFGRYVVSATTPFTRDDLEELHRDAPAVVGRLFPTTREVYERLGWRMFPRIDRVYVNARARAELGWNPRYDFAPRPRAAAGGQLAAQRARDQHRSQGLPRRDDGALHHALTARAATRPGDHSEMVRSVVRSLPVRRDPLLDRGTSAGHRRTGRGPERPAGPGTHGSSGVNPARVAAAGRATSGPNPSANSVGGRGRTESRPLWRP